MGAVALGLSKNNKTFLKNLSKDNVSLIVSFGCESALVVPPNALLMANFQTFFTLSHKGHIEKPHQIPVVHADFAHLPFIDALTTAAQMLLQQEVVVVQLLFEIFWLTDEVKGQVAVA